MTATRDTTESGARHELCPMKGRCICLSMAPATLKRPSAPPTGRRPRSPSDLPTSRLRDLTDQQGHFLSVGFKTLACAVLTRWLLSLTSLPDRKREVVDPH